MAQAYGLNYNPALDGNGEPIDGALLHTYEPGTVIPKATYTTSALNVEHDNPVEADSAGRFPQLFAGEGVVFDFLLTDSDGANGRTFADVAAVGGLSTVLERDFGVNGRFQVYGLGGVIQIETGPPTGDDVGGQGRLGGWDGTQGDSLEIDYAATTATGSIESDISLEAPVIIRNGVTEWVPRLLLSGTATASSSMVLALDGTFECWELQLRNIKGTLACTVRAVLSFDNGATYKTAAGDYIYHGISQDNAGGGFITATSQAVLNLMTADPAPTGNSDVVAKIFSKAGAETRLIVDFRSDDPTGAVTARTALLSSATNAKNYGKADHIRLDTNTSTATYDYRLYGIP